MRRLKRLISLAPLLLLLSLIGAPVAMAQSVSIPTQINTQNTTAESSGLTAGALNADLLPATDVSNFKSYSLQVSGTWSATLTLQGSNDLSTWVTVPGWLTTDNTQAARSTLGTNGIICGPVVTHYMRVRETAWTSGTANGVCEFYSYPFSAATIGVSGVVTANVTSGTVQIIPQISGGSSVTKVISAATTNATSVKATAGQLYSVHFFNVAAYACYVHFYNKTSAPTVGTDVPIFTVGIPAGGQVYWHDPTGIACNAGIAYSITKGVGDTDATAVAAADVVGLETYK